MGNDVEETKWMVKVKGKELTIALPEGFTVDTNIKEIPLEDFINIVLQKNGAGEDSLKACFPKIKHCCVKPPQGTKYVIGGSSWCSN